MDVVNRFARYYFGDRILRRWEVETGAGTVRLELDSALLLKDHDHPSIIDPAEKFQPAVVSFLHCRELRMSESAYAMNSTIVEYTATSRDDGHTDFRFALTGGWDNETFWRELHIVADDFVVIQGSLRAGE